MRESRGVRARRPTFPETLTRSLARSGLVYALVAVLLVSAASIAGDSTSRPGGSGVSSHAWSHPSWEPAYEARFPGCVDVETWTGLEVPTAVVVVRRAGDVVRMRFDEAYERARTSSPADDVWTVGACP